jgi:hypothetical protein
LSHLSHLSPCDKFLCGFKGTACGRASGGAMGPKRGKSRGGMPVEAAGSSVAVGPAESEKHLSWGEGGPGGGVASPAASGAGAPRRGPPAARSAPPNRPARRTRRNDRASWRAREPPAATGTRTTTPIRGLIRGKFNPGACAVRGEVRSPNHHWRSLDVSRNLSRAPTASLRDRLRRHLTESVRR